MEPNEAIEPPLGPGLPPRVVFGDLEVTGNLEWRLPVTIDGHACELTIAADLAARINDWTFAVVLLGDTGFDGRPACKQTVTLVWWGERNLENDEIIAHAKRWAESELVALGIHAQAHWL